MSAADDSVRDAGQQQLRLPSLASLAASPPPPPLLFEPATLQSKNSISSDSNSGSSSAGLPVPPSMAHSSSYGNSFASMNALASTSQQAYDIPTSTPGPAVAAAAAGVGSLFAGYSESPGDGSSNGMSLAGTKRKESSVGSGSDAGGHDASDAAKAKKVRSRVSPTVPLLPSPSVLFTEQIILTQPGVSAKDPARVRHLQAEEDQVRPVEEEASRPKRN